MASCGLSPRVTSSPLGHEFLQMRPDLGPDAVHQLSVRLAEHHRDGARVQAGNAALFNHSGEMDPGLPDHTAEQGRPVPTRAQRQG